MTMRDKLKEEGEHEAELGWTRRSKEKEPSRTWQGDSMTDHKKLIEALRDHLSTHPEVEDGSYDCGCLAALDSLEAEILRLREAAEQVIRKWEAEADTWGGSTTTGFRHPARIAAAELRTALQGGDDG